LAVLDIEMGLIDFFDWWDIDDASLTRLGSDKN
jgi:hypothetical protein